MTAKDRITVHIDKYDKRKVDYKKAISLCADEKYRYDLYGYPVNLKDTTFCDLKSNLSPKELEKEVNSSHYNLVIVRKTLRIAGVEVAQNDFAVAHADSRRMIYDPEKFTENFLNPNYGRFYWHNVIVINNSDEPNSKLGGHHHDYIEMFVVPVGEFKFVLLDPEDSKNPQVYNLYTGNRIVIPEGIDHVIKGDKNSVLMAFGNVEFDPKRLIPSEKTVLETLLD